MKIEKYRLGFLGFGHMAEVLFQAIDQARLISRDQVLFVRRDPLRARENEKTFNIAYAPLKTVVHKSDLLILAVRPTQIEPLLRDLALIGLGSKMVISILAGTKLALFQKYLSSEVQLLRVMPNLASAVGEGMSVLTFAPNATTEFKTVAHQFFSCSGAVTEVPEALMDLACGLTGSGPGFVLRLIEAAARFGEQHGLAYPQALKMVAQTFVGAARLVLKGHLPTDLLLQIAVPGGTTEAGLHSMKETHIEKHFQAAIDAALHKSKEMGSLGGAEGRAQ